MATDSQGAVADLRCFSVSRDSRHLGLIRRLSVYKSLCVIDAAWW